MPAGVSDEILGMVYAPQLVCSACGNFLTYGFLHGASLLGYECGDRFGATKTWVQTMEKARAYTFLDDFRKEERISPKQVGMMRGLACWTQLWPDHRFAAGMFKLMQSGEDLADNRKVTVRQMLEERGGWEALIVRRDHIYRCEVMELLSRAGRKIAYSEDFYPLGMPMVSGDDLAVFRSLKADAYRRGLSEKQAGKLYKMEEPYLELKSSLARLVGRILFQGRGA
jgi:hypothetical protein